jgi:hypothetical protein
LEEELIPAAFTLVAMSKFKVNKIAKTKEPFFIFLIFPMLYL